MGEMIDYEFKVVKYNKRRKRKCKHKIYLPVQIDDLTSDITIEEMFRMFVDAQNLLKSSDQIHYFRNTIDACGKHLDNNNNFKSFKEIVCYGLGKFSRNYQALHQLALLLELKVHCGVPVYIYDPVFNNVEKEFLSRLDLTLIDENEEGKRKVSEKTLCFLPHCPRQLLNNLLWINWGLSLSNCIILGNKHSDIITNTPSSLLTNFWYLTKITPAIEEYIIPNVYRYKDIFNDLAVHIFLPEKLNHIPADIWKYHKIPRYSNEDKEFISNS